MIKYKTQKTTYDGKGNPNYGNHKLAGKNHPLFGIKGKNHPAYKDNKYECCVDCGKTKKHPESRNPRCQSCATFHQYKTSGVPTWKRIRYKGIWMRSTWEVKYAKYLTKHHVKWEYEPKTFDLGSTTYTPDFYLPERNAYVEIKGWWRKGAIEKLELFKKKYPNVKLEILTFVLLKFIGIL